MPPPIPVEPSRFALQQAIEQAALVELENSGGATGEFGQQRFLSGRFYACQNGVGPRQQIGDFHNFTKGLTAVDEIRPARSAAL